MTQMLCSRMYPLSCANTYHDVWDFKVHERVRNKKKLKISRTEHDFSM